MTKEIKKLAVVIPSIRPFNFINMLNAWEGFPGVQNLYVVWDLNESPMNAAKIQDCIKKYRSDYKQLKIHTVNREAFPDFISKRDSACRALGLLEAYRDGNDLTWTIDDDCYPLMDCSPGVHIHKLKKLFKDGVPTAQSSILNERCRGLPYDSDARIYPSCNMGLWHNVPDIDGATQLIKGSMSGEAELPSGTNVLPQEVWMPMCGMNLSFRTELTPYFWFPPMGLDTPYARFDDIWAGLMAYWCLKLTKKTITYGEPNVWHSRASDAMTNLVKEAPGLPRNEELWELFIGSTMANITRTDPFDVYDELTLRLAGSLKTCGFDEDYRNRWLDGMEGWLKACREVKNDA